MRRFAVWLVVLTSTSAGLAWLHSQRGLPVDDGFIVLRYVDHLLAGNGLVYNPGERVEGFSSPLWIFTLALLEQLMRFFAPPDPERLVWLNRGLGVASAAGAVLATGLLAGRVGVPKPYQLGAALGVALSWPFVFWSGAGLETPLFALLLALTAFRLLARDPFTGGNGIVTVAVLTGLGTCRPEGPMYVLLAAGLLWRRRSDVQAGRVAALLGAMAGLHVLLLVARFAYYGELVPNTYHAKVGGGALTLLRGAYYLYDYVARGGGAVVGLLAALGAWGVLRSADPSGSVGAAPRGPLVLLGAGLGFILIVGGDGLYCFRFIAHLLPLLWAYAAQGAASLEWRVRGRLGARASWLAHGTFAASVFVAVLPLVEDEDILLGGRNVLMRGSEAAWSELGRVLRVNLPRGSLLATNVAGKVPYESRLPTIDMLGLTDSVIARTEIPAMGRGYAGHEKANVEYVLAKRPAVVFISVLERLPLDMFSNPRECEMVLATSVLHSYAPLLSNPSFLRDYVPAHILRSGGSASPVFLRRDLAAGGDAEPNHPPAIQAFTWEHPH